MYKPPENTNRVKAMKMIFETQDANKVKEDIIDVNKPKIPNIRKAFSDKPVETDRNIVNSTNVPNRPQPTLNRQLSDPNKRNIKRTPAFRLDKTTFIEREHMFQRHLSQNHIKTRMDKFKSSSDDSSRLKENCDTVNISDLPTKKPPSKLVNDIKNKLYSIRDEAKHDKIEKCDRVIVKDVYAEAVPKSLRFNHNKIDDLSPQISDEKVSKIETAQKVITILKDIDQQLNGTDTIKNALKRPLPPGPAPKKPPRTFQHSPQSKAKLESLSSLSVSRSDPNIAALKLDKEFTNQLNLSIERKLQPPPKTKRDARYMLDKLENALKNNKIKLKRQAKIDYNSEDEDNTKTTTKSLCSSPLLKRLNPSPVSLSPNHVFNCLPSLGCSRNTYARIKEPNSSFFIGCSDDEPVYAEPFQFSSEDHEVSRADESLNGMKRNSLYYMSNPVLGLGLESDVPDGGGNNRSVTHEDMEQTTTKEMVNQYETSSLSTFSSDSESNVSPPAYLKEPSFVLVKDLIKSFEGKVSTHEENSEIVDGSSLREQYSSDGISDTRRYGIVRHPNNTGERKKKDMEKFKIYVTAVRSFSIRKMSNDGLFHCCLLVGLDEKSPYVKSKFPANVQIPDHIEKLCFPDSDDHRVSYSAREQCYSLVIMNSTGERIYGYCRRVLPEGSCCCLPLAYCILTRNRAPRFYKRVLQELESHHGLPDKQREAVMNEFYKQKFPKPGNSIRLNLSRIIHSEVKYYGTETTPQNNNELELTKSDDSLGDFCLIMNPCPHGFIKSACDPGRKVCESCRAENSSELVLTLHQDIRYEETDLKELCDTLDASILLKIFENLLLERKIIFTSCQLSKLSACIEAIQSVLYPFTWPHAFIPVLPKTMWEVVDSPAPVICGVLSPTVVNEYKIEDGIVVDLDAKQILLEVDEYENVLPCSAVKYWKKGLSVANSMKTTDNEHNVLLSDAFIRVFILTCGHYKEHISNGVFDKQGFKNAPNSKGVKRFLQWFTLTTMFDFFIESVLASPNSFYMFDKRIEIYCSQDATLILEKMKDWTNNLKF